MAVTYTVSWSFQSADKICRNFFARFIKLGSPESCAKCRAILIFYDEDIGVSGFFHHGLFCPCEWEKWANQSNNIDITNISISVRAILA